MIDGPISEMKWSDAVVTQVERKAKKKEEEGTLSFLTDLPRRGEKRRPTFDGSISVKMFLRHEIDRECGGF